MDRVIKYMVDLLWDWPLIITILSTGIYYTMSSGFFQIKYFKYIWKKTFKNIKKENRNENTFQVLFTAIGTTSGIGNITGVATAVVIGGPGAIFWLLFTGILGMIIKMSEVTLAVYYRDERKDGTVGGGPMQYIEKGIGESMNFKSSKILIGIFCIGIVSTLIFTIQNYNASIAIADSFEVPIIEVAVLYSIITYVAIYNGVKGIKRIFVILVPIITLVYVSAGIIVMLRNSPLLISAIKAILVDAFKISSIAGGIAGRGIHETISMGMSRAVYSSEAGWGTSAMIHSTAMTKHPVEQGLMGVLEVFFDTIIICSTTGIVIVMGMISGISVTSKLVIESFSLGIGSWSQLIIPITIFLFGLTTSIGWYSYYESIVLYFSSRSKIKFNEKVILKIMKCIYPLPGLIIVIIATNFGGIGVGVLWNFADVLAGLPTFINIFAILLLSDKFFELLKDYEQKFIKVELPEDEIPLFYSEEEKDYYEF